MGVPKADVYDLNNYKNEDLKSEEVFALDTNVLYWMHYTRCVQADHLTYQVNKYPNFISDLVEKGIKLVTTIYNITELLYIIENHEYKIYKLTDPGIKKKEFRDILAERLKVKSELDTVLSQIKELYDIKKFNIEILGIDSYITDFGNHNCDDFDYLIIKYLKENGIKNMITDDRDYISVDGITLFTANSKTISIASTNNLLINI